MKNKITWLFLFVTIQVLAQHSIKGVVLNKDTQKPLEYVNIYFPELEKGTYSNENGEFVLINLPSGDYKIIISFVGYKTLSQQIIIPTEEQFIFNLESAVLQIDEIILSTPFHKLQSDNVMKVERKTSEELKSTGAVNLSEGISNIAGVETLSTGLGIGKPVIRGLSSNRVLVYSQGIRLENQQFGAEHGLGVNSSGIESVEVIKGPSSLLYGSDAIGGVLYLNPERFANNNEKSGDINFDYFTSTNGYNIGAGYKTSPNKFKLLFRGSLAEHSDYKTKDYRVTNTRFREQDFKVGLGYHDVNFSTDFRYNINASKVGIPEEIGFQSTNKTPLLPFQEINNHVFSLKNKYFLENSKIELNLGYIYNDRKEFEEHHEHEHEGEEDHDEHDEEHEGEEDHDEHEEVEAALDTKLKTFSYDLKYHLPALGKFEIITGTQGMYQKNVNKGEEELIPDATTNDFGVFATSHLHFRTLDLQFGLRYDYREIQVLKGINKKFNSFNGAFGFKKDFKNIITRLNIATGFRAPNLSELTSYGSHHGVNRFEIGNENLNNEYSYQADISFEYVTEHLEVFVNGFYNNISDYIYLSPNGTVIDNNPVYEYLQDDAKLYGGEISVHFHPHPLDWLHIESTFETVTGKQNNGNYLPLIPANKLSNTLRVNFKDLKLKNNYAYLSFNTYFKQNNVSEFETVTPSYSLLNLGFGGEISSLNNTIAFKVSCNNLSDKQYISHLSRLKADNIYNIGRNFHFGIEYKF